ncbi:CAP domain-containing protein [Flavobacteriaceae bacterium MHTCC 0001]
MRSLIKVYLLACLALLWFSCSTESFEDELVTISNEELTVPETKAIEIEILELINNHRSTKGLTPLTSLSIIKSTAHSHTDYMVDNQRVSHDNFFARSNYLKNNAGALRVSENVAYGYTSAASVVRAWIKSEGHKATIEGDFTNFEISAEKDIDGKWYYTNIFIKK